MNQNITYLALGDSYTIGELVPLVKSYPYQTVQLLRQKGVTILAPEIIAKTGWTTDELNSAMTGYSFLPRYDLVSLLIGVNNQYRGRSAEEYKKEFSGLLQKAIELAGGKADRVVVLSIPDWGVTPFGQSKGEEKITREIDAFNTINKQVAEQYKTHYVEITIGSRDAKTDLSLLASDQLHPSEKEYRKWAEKLYRELLLMLKLTE